MENLDALAVEQEQEPLDPHEAKWIIDSLEPETIQVDDQIAQMYHGDLLGLLKELEINELLIPIIMFANDFDHPSDFTSEDTELVSYNAESVEQLLKNN